LNTTAVKKYGEPRHSGDESDVPPEGSLISEAGFVFRLLNEPYGRMD